MHNGFTRSAEGVKEYQKIEKEYPNTLTDDNYERFLKRNANSPHSARNRKEIRVLVRELANDGEQYLIWDMYEVMYSPLGAEDEFYLHDLGMYPRPVTKQKIVFGPNMETHEVITGDIVRNDIGYTTPYTRENVEALHKFSTDKRQQGKTNYIVRRIGGRSITVPTYEDFRDRDFEDLETGAYLFEEIEDSPSTKSRKSSKAKTVSAIPTE